MDLSKRESVCVFGGGEEQKHCRLSCAHQTPGTVDYLTKLKHPSSQDITFIDSYNSPMR